MPPDFRGGFLFEDLTMKKETSTCSGRVCRLSDCAFIQSVRVRKEVSTFLEGKLHSSVKPESLPIEAEKFLVQEPKGSTYQSIDFSLVLKLLYVCGGRINFVGSSEYRQCPLNGGADFQMEGVELITTDFDQILARMRMLIDTERSTNCTSVRKDHVCKPIYQLAHLREIELKRKEEGQLTFEAVREKLEKVCYEVTFVLESARPDRKEFSAAKRQAS
jgi:hypothetical protein